MTPPLPYILITVKAIKFQKVSLSDRQNITTVFSTMTAGHKYSILNKDNLTQSIQMQLSLKGKNFSHFFFCIFEM